MASLRCACLAIAFLAGCGRPSAPESEPSHATRIVDGDALRRVAGADEAAGLEVGDAPPGNDPWDSKTSQERLRKSKTDLQAAMDEIGKASEPVEISDAEGRAAMALTAMRHELDSTAEGRAEYVRRREALGAATAAARGRSSDTATDP